jgi:hypothetical protein
MRLTGRIRCFDLQTSELEKLRTQPIWSNAAGLRERKTNSKGASRMADFAFDYDDSALPALLVAGDAGAPPMWRALERAGFRARAPIGFDAAAHAFIEQGDVALLAIDATGAPDALLEPVLARADMLATERSRALVAEVSLGQLDVAVAQLAGPRVQLLCEPTEVERTAALALARHQARGRLNDGSRDDDTRRLQRLNEEVARIADVLARLTRDEEIPKRGLRENGQGYRGESDAPVDAVTAQDVRAAIRVRRMRVQFFEGELFADPAWDMLLDLYAAALEKSRVSVSSLCIAASVPPTTALRWIGTLHDAGLFERQPDPSDRRRAYIGLSAKGLAGMNAYAVALKRAGLHFA